MVRKSLAFLLLISILSCDKEEIEQPAKETYPIPGDQFFPEGIAYDNNTGFFTQVV